MTLQQIRCFLSAVETGSISEAAKRLYVAQSSVSTAIRELERYCGVQLLQRNAKGVILTGAGEELLSEMLVIDKKMDYIKNKYNTQNKKSETFSVAAQHHICGLDGFLSVISKVTSEDYKFCFLECATSEIMENVEHGYADIGVFFFAQQMEKQVIQEMKNHNLQYYPFGKEKIHVHMRKNHPLANKDAIFLNDLKAYPCVTYDRVLGSHPFSGEVIAECPKKIGTTDRAAAYSIIGAMDAVIIGTSYVPLAEQKQEIIARPLEDGYMIQLVYILRKDYVFSDLAKKFIDTITL